MRFEVPSGDLAALLSSVRRVSDDVRSAREDKGEDGFLCNQMTLRPGRGAEHPARGYPKVSTECWSPTTECWRLHPFSDSLGEPLPSRRSLGEARPRMVKAFLGSILT